MNGLPVILASGSASRCAVLAAAGIEAEAIKPNVDEETARDAMRAGNVPPGEQAMQLAELKAIKVSHGRPGLVIGGDQMLALGDQVFDKPADMAEAKANLTKLAGKAHTLETALAIAENGNVVWRYLARPKLTMRPLSEEFIDSYLERAGEAVLTSVGAYQLESLGSQLFTKIEGDYFSILGLPLLPLLDYLRTRNVIAT